MVPCVRRELKAIAPLLASGSDVLVTWVPFLVMEERARIEHVASARAGDSHAEAHA